MESLGRVNTAYRGVEVAELPVRSVLNRSSGRRVAMDLTINPYRGCEFGCRYCYARYTHQFLEHHDPSDFERRIYAKLTAPEKLAAELARLDVAGRHIAIGTATDPYQPIERQLGLTRGILAALSGCRGATITLLTKSDLITRDIDLYRKLHERHELSLAFTMVGLDRQLLRRLEPRAPTPQKRLEAMAELAGAGVRVGVSFSPVLPGINDGEADMDELLAAAAAHGASFAFSQTLWIASAARALLFDWLAETFPEQLPHYRRLYRDGIDAPDELRREIAARFAAGCARHGLLNARRGLRSQPQQLSLFDDHRLPGSNADCGGQLSVRRVR